MVEAMPPENYSANHGLLSSSAYQDQLACQKHDNFGLWHFDFLPEHE